MSGNTTLSFSDIIDVCNELCPPLYYFETELVIPGKVLYCEKQELEPDFIMCHPDDVSKIKREITNRRITPAPKDVLVRWTNAHENEVKP